MHHLSSKDTIQSRNETFLNVAPEESRRRWGKKMAPIRGPGQEADPTASDTLEGHTALWRYIPHLKAHKGVTHWKFSEYNKWWRTMEKPCTIIAVSMGEADTRREPLGDQAMEVTGEWPGWDKTCAHPDEGLFKRRKSDRYRAFHHNVARSYVRQNSMLFR